MNRIIAILSLILVVTHCALAEAEPERYQKIKIKPIFSKLVTRDDADRVYSGQITSEVGLVAFGQKYRVDVDKSLVDFKNQMLIFGITDNISSRAFQFLKQEKIRTFTLDYAKTGIEYKLRMPDEGMKHSYVQVFVLKKTEGISHVRVKNYLKNGLSKVYDK